MNSQGRRAWLCFLLAAVATSLAPGARADETIGVASVVRNDVSGVLVSGTVKVDTGASVVRNEIMKTAGDSSAKLVFTDSTNLALGPNSTVKLDHFVSSGPSSYGKVTIDVAKGVFRFTTGHSDKRAYEINTGVASIGVRGTIFEGEAAPRKTRLHVVEGVVDVRTKNGRFCELHAGQSAIVTDIACTPISGFDPGLSPELTEIQEFSQLQPGEQGIFAAESPAMYLVPAAVVAGGVATGVTVGTQQSHPNNSTQELLLWQASHPPQPVSP
jgi:FecR protein